MGDEEVSVRELRQNLSVYLRRVEEGETLAVTSRGRRVAVLAPTEGASRLGRLIAEGRVATPARPSHLVAPEPAADGERPLTDALLALRDEDPR
jgi:prevent-host-death family protein